MNRILTRTLGIALIAAGVAGLVFSILGLVALGPVEQRVRSTVMEQVDIVDRALAATGEALSLAETSLDQVAKAAGSLESAMTGAVQAVGDAGPALDSVAEFMGEQLPTAIESTQETLISVAQSAQIVDDILALITDLPLPGMARYNPEVPLHRSFQELSKSLDEIPASLGTAQQGLLITIDNLDELGADFEAMAVGVGELVRSLESARSILTEYQDVVADLQSLVGSARGGLPDWLRWIRLGISLALIWLGIAQVGLITQGWELVARTRRTDR